MKFSARLTGIEELDRTFSRLPMATQRRAYVPALRSGANPVRKAATANLRTVSQPFSGLARRANTLAVYKLKNFQGHFRVAVQVRRGLTNSVKKDKDGKPVRVGMYLAVLEYGSQKLRRPPRSWLRKALREQKSIAVDSIRAEFSKRMNDVVLDAKGKR